MTNNQEIILACQTNSNDGDVSGWHEGYDPNNGYASADYWLVKLDSLGNILWEKCFGGSGNDFGNGIILNQDGGYALAGSSNSGDGDVTGNHVDSTGFTNDYWVVKTDSTGNLEWEKSLGDTD